MTDLHRQLEAWLVDGANGDPPREVAVHAALCDVCAAQLGAFDAIANVEVGRVDPPPPLAPPTRLGLLWARLRVVAAVAGTVLAGAVVVLLAGQLVGLGDSGGQPEQTVLGGIGSPGGSGETLTSEQATFGPVPAVEPTPSPTDTPIPAPSLAPPRSQAPRPTATPPPSVAPPTPPPSPPPSDTPTPTPTAPPTAPPTDPPPTPTPTTP